MSAVYNSTVQGFYLSYYGRPADPAGLTFWTGQLAAAGGNLSSILNAFGTSAEATRRYGTGTTESKIQAVYQQTFGRAADAAGLAFYNTEITAGRITLIDMSKRIIDGATGDDVAIRNNRTSAAQSFTDKLDTDAKKAGYSGSSAEDSARTWISAVTKDAATVTAAVASADATITALLPGTFTLTTGVDKFTGGGGDDTFTGGVSSLTASDTLGATDVLDGGAGADVANLSISKSFSGFSTGVGSMKGIETVNLTNTTTSAYDFTARGVTDVTTYNVKGLVNVLGNSSLTPKVVISGLSTSTTGTVTVGFDTEVVSGTADSYTVGVSSVGKAAVTTAPTSAEVPHNVLIDGIETITVEATGANFIALTSNNQKDIKAIGEGSLKLNEVGTAAKTVDGSALKGSLDVNVGEATNITSIKGGDGADVFRVLTGDLTGNAVVAGGAGADTLRMNTDGTTTVAYAMTGVETVFLDSVANTLNFSLTNASGVEKFTLSKTAGAVTTTVSDMGSAAYAVDIQADSNAAAGTDATLSLDTTGAVTAQTTVSSSATTAAYEGSSDNLTLTKATSLTFTVAALGHYDGTITGNKLTSATLNLAGGTNTHADAASGITLASNALLSLIINQTDSRKTDTKVTVNKGDGTASKITSVDLTITKGLNVTATDNLVALNNLSVNTSVASDLSGANIVGASDNLTKINTMTLRGSTADSSIKLGNIGSTSLEQAVTINANTANSLKGTVGLSLGTVSTAAGQAITIDVTGVDGDLTIGNITTNSATSGSVTINANGLGDASGDDIGIGTITSGTIDINVNATTGNTTISTLTGNAVKFVGTTAAGTVAVGDGGAGTDVTARSSLTYHGPDLAVSDIDVVIASGSTAFTGDIKGGILSDTFDFTSASTGQTSITLTGALGAGTNSVNIESTVSVVTGGQTIDISGVTGVSTAQIRGGAFADTIKGSTGVDTIFAGAGADTLTGGGGNDRFKFDQNSDTGAVGTVTTSTSTASFAANYVITGGDRVSTTGFDRITDFNIGDIIYTARSGAPASTTALKVGSTLAADRIATISGTFNSSANTFTFSNSGSDSLFVWDGVGDGASGSYRGVVLVGFASGFTIDATTGVTGASS